LKGRKENKDEEKGAEMLALVGQFDDELRKLQLRRVLRVSAGDLGLLLRAHGGCDETTDARHGRARCGTYLARERFASPVQETEVEHHQDDDTRQRHFRHQLVPQQLLLRDLPLSLHFFTH